MRFTFLILLCTCDRAVDPTLLPDGGAGGGTDAGSDMNPPPCQPASMETRECADGINSQARMCLGTGCGEWSQCQPASGVLIAEQAFASVSSTSLAPMQSYYQSPR